MAEKCHRIWKQILEVINKKLLVSQYKQIINTLCALHKDSASMLMVIFPLSNDEINTIEDSAISMHNCQLSQITMKVQQSYLLEPHSEAQISTPTELQPISTALKKLIHFHLRTNLQHSHVYRQSCIWYNIIQLLKASGLMHQVQCHRNEKKLLTKRHGYTQ